MASHQATVKLSSGHEMPLVGFGLWKVDNATCADQVYAAIKAGYRLLDGAADYGNEKEAGQGVARAIADGLVKRSELFITSKLWCCFHDREHVEPIVRRQLKDWGLDYFDLYLMHFPIATAYVDPDKRYPAGWSYEHDGGPVKRGTASIQETWQAMEPLVDAGLARSIGVSNFRGALLIDLLCYARIHPAVHQFEHHPYLVQARLLDLCERENIHVTAYSSFGPQSFIELDWEKAKNVAPLLKHDVVNRVAKNVGKSPAQVLLRWATQRGVAVIPKSNQEQRLKENLDVTAWDLSPKDLESITALDMNLRFNDPADQPLTAGLLIWA